MTDSLTNKNNFLDLPKQIAVNEEQNSQPIKLNSSDCPKPNILKATTSQCEVISKRPLSTSSSSPSNSTKSLDKLHLQKKIKVTKQKQKFYLLLKFMLICRNNKRITTTQQTYFHKNENLI